MNDLVTGDGVAVSDDNSVTVIQEPSSVGIIQTGDQGPPGIRGNSVLSGPTDPTNLDGRDGDYYINTSTYFIFGPKAAGFWPPAGTSMVGPPGPVSTADPPLQITGNKVVLLKDSTLVVTGGALGVAPTIAPLDSPLFTGDPRAPTPTTADNDTSIATTAYVKANLATYAPLNAPVFTGDARSVTPSAGDNDTSIATTAFVTTALAAVSVGVIGQCQLQYISGAQLRLVPYNGNKIVINATTQTIPDAGVNIASGTFTNAVSYFIYAFMSGGVMTLENSTTAPAVQAGTGIKIKSGDATRTLVGFVQMQGGTFQDNNAMRLVRSWFNDRQCNTSTTLSGNITTTSTTWVEVDSSARMQALLWNSEFFRGWITGSVISTTQGMQYQFGLAFNGGTGSMQVFCFGYIPVASYYIPFSVASSAYQATADALNYISIHAQANAAPGFTTSGITTLTGVVSR